MKLGSIWEKRKKPKLQDGIGINDFYLGIFLQIEKTKIDSAAMFSPCLT